MKNVIKLFILSFSSFVFLISSVSAATLFETGVNDTPGNADAVFVSGDFLYIADGTAGMQIYNITNLAESSLVGSLSFSGYTYSIGIFVVGNYAYVADDYAQKLRIVDISNPAAPIQVGLFSASSSVKNVTVVGNYAYIANGTLFSGQKGFEIIDISNPASPTLVGSYNSGFSNDVKVVGDFAYVAASSGVKIFNVSNPASPTLVGTASMTTYSYGGGIRTAKGIFVSGDYIFIAADSAGLQIFDASNPVLPVYVGEFDTSGDAANSVKVVGNNAYIVDINTGLYIVDISNPVTPLLIGTYDSSTSSSVMNSLEVVQNYVYITDGSLGVRTIRTDFIAPISFTPVFNIVSPANNTTPTLTFSTTDNIGISSYQVKVDSGDFAAQISPYTLPALIEGSHTITARAYDAAGNYTDGTVTVVIDLTAPTAFTPVITSPTNDTTPTLTFSATDNNSIAAYQVKIDSGDFSTQTSPYTLPALTEGSHTITARAYDAAGNYTDGTVTVVIDTTAPVITISGDAKITLPIGSTYTDKGAAATDNVDGDITSSIVKTGTVNTNKEGSYFIAYNATDAAGNAATEVKRHIVIKPVAAILKDLNKNIKADPIFTDKIKGKIFIQTEGKGEAWYVSPKTGKKYSLGKPADAFAIIKKLGIGISNADLAKIPRNGTKDKGNQAMMNRLKGKILIQVQSKGEAWYVHPITGKRYFLGRPADAFKLIKRMAIGITNANLNKVSTGLVVR